MYLQGIKGCFRSSIILNLAPAPAVVITVESRDYAPPLCMLGLGKSGEGAYTRDPYISV